MTNRIGFRQWNKDKLFYVAQLPGDGGKDWGYTEHIHGRNEFDKAIHLTPYWQRRFAKDCRRVGSVAKFIE